MPKGRRKSQGTQSDIDTKPPLAPVSAPTKPKETPTKTQSPVLPNSKNESTEPWVVVSHTKLDSKSSTLPPPKKSHSSDHSYRENPPRLNRELPQKQAYTHHQQDFIKPMSRRIYHYPKDAYQEPVARNPVIAYPGPSQTTSYAVYELTKEPPKKRGWFDYLAPQGSLPLGNNQISKSRKNWFGW